MSVLSYLSFSFFVYKFAILLTLAGCCEIRYVKTLYKSQSSMERFLLLLLSKSHKTRQILQSSTTEVEGILRQSQEGPKVTQITQNFFKRKQHLNWTKDQQASSGNTHTGRQGQPYLGIILNSHCLCPCICTLNSEREKGSFITGKQCVTEEDFEIVLRKLDIIFQIISFQLRVKSAQRSQLHNCSFHVLATLSTHNYSIITHTYDPMWRLYVEYQSL